LDRFSRNLVRTLYHCSPSQRT